MRLALLHLLALASLGRAQEVPPPDPRLDWWREARFGRFVHFGLHAVLEATHMDTTLQAGFCGAGSWARPAS